MHVTGKVAIKFEALVYVYRHIVCSQQPQTVETLQVGAEDDKSVGILLSRHKVVFEVSKLKSPRCCFAGVEIEFM